MDDFDPLTQLPLPGGLVKCGNRTDLPKKQRRHHYVSLGIDVRHSGDGTFKDFEVFVCSQCGADKQHKIVEAS